LSISGAPEQGCHLADKRRPRTRMPPKKQQPIILKFLFNRITLLKLRMS